MRFVTGFVAGVICIFSGSVLAQTTIESTWNGSTGNWIDSNGWSTLGSGDTFPDNGGSFIYDVILPGGLYRVTTAGSVDIDLLSLQIGASARLALEDDFFAPGVLSNDGIVEVNEGTLLLHEAAVNGGVIRFDVDASDAEDIVIGKSLTLGGDGRIVFRDNHASEDYPETAEIVIGSNGAVLTQGGDHSIEGGPGRIRGYGGGAVSFINEGGVRANVPLRTIVFDAGTSGLAITNYGQMSAEDLATLRFDGVELACTSGLLLADSGILDFNGAAISGDGVLELRNFGQVDFDSATTAEFSTISNMGGGIPYTGAALTANIYDGKGVLTVDSVFTAESTFTLRNGAVLNVDDTATVDIGHQFVNEMTAESDFNLGSNGTLRFDSATSVSPLSYELFGTMEVAGEDMGFIPAGFVGNFLLPNLVVAPGAKVNLVDLRDNGNRGGGSEALYVDTLTFADSNGLLNVNGLNLYYNTLVGNPLQIKDSQSATPSTWTCGSGNWNSTACWDQLAGTDNYPDNNGYEYTVSFPTAAEEYTVSTNVSGVNINSVDVGSNAILGVTSTFYPGFLSVEGIVETQGGPLTLDEDVLNNGVIRYDTDSYSEYIYIQGDVSLNGTGSLQFTNPSGSTSYRDRLDIYDTARLTNGAGHTVEGGYALIRRYSGNAAFVNNGDVRSNVDRSIEFETSGEPGSFTVTNNELMTAENSSALIFDGPAITNTGIIAADGADTTVNFGSNTTLDNRLGTLRASSGGEIEISSQIAQVADMGTFDAAGGRVEFRGTINDTGTWLVDESYGDFAVTSYANLTGVTVDTGGDQVFALQGSATFTDVTNLGLMENQSSTLSLHGDFTNNGVLRFDTDSSSEYITIPVSVNLLGTGSISFQNSSGGTSYRDRVDIHDGATLTNGADHTLDGGYAYIRRYSGNAAFVNNGKVLSNNDREIEFETSGEPTTLTVTNNNRMAAENSSVLRFDGAGVSNRGVIEAAGDGSSVIFETNTTLDNELGILSASSNGWLRINSEVAGATGFGTIDADGGKVDFGGKISGTDTWLVDDTYGDFGLVSYAEVSGITIDTGVGNVFQIRGSSTFNDVTNLGLIELQSGYITLHDGLTNDGTIRFDTDSATESIIVEGNITLEGSGTILFQNSSSSTSGRDRIYVRDTFTLVNGPDHKLVGGNAWIQRDSGTAAFVNQGEVRCDLDRILVIDGLSSPADNFVVTNTGTMAAENGGELWLEDVAVINEGLMRADGAGTKVRFQAVSTLDNTNGILQATDGGTIQLDSTVSVAEIADLGMIAATNGFVLMSAAFNQPRETWVIDEGYGDFTLQSGTNLSGITIQSPNNHLVKLSTATDFTDVTVDGAIIEIMSYLNLHGTFTNNGIVRSDSDSYGENLSIAEDMTLGGSGTIQLLNPSSTYRDSIQLVGDITAINSAGHTIEGNWMRFERQSGNAKFVNDGLVQTVGAGTISTSNASGNYTNFHFENNNQMLALDDADFSFEKVTFTNNGTVTARGTGSNATFYSSTSLINTDGLLIADDGGTVRLSSLTTDYAGSFNATSNGEVEFYASTVRGLEAILVDSGYLDVDNSTITGTGTLVLSGSGDAVFDQNSTVSFGSIDHDGDLFSIEGSVSADTYRGTGVLSIPGSLAVAQTMAIEAGSDVSVGSAGNVVVGENYDLQMVADINYVFATGSKLQMTGGVSVAPGAFDEFVAMEVAGRDLDENDDPTQGSSAGFTGNFSLPELVIGAGARVKLVDNRDNDHRGGADTIGEEAEALYVNTLTFTDAAGALALNSKRIYYNSTNAGPGQIVIGFDCNSNGVADNVDIAEGTSSDCDGSSVPDECEIAAGTSSDCNENLVPDTCDIAGSTSDDCNSNGIPDECDIATGASYDINGNDIPDECEDDCNFNGVPDATDITEGTSQDCNYNGIPDECEPGGATSVWVAGGVGFFYGANNWDPPGIPNGKVIVSNSGSSDSICRLNTPGVTPVCDLLVEATGTGWQDFEINTGSVLSTVDGSLVSTGGRLSLRGGSMIGGPLVNSGAEVNGYGTVSVAFANEGVLTGSALAPLVFDGSAFENQTSGSIIVPSSSVIHISTPLFSHSGTMEIHSNASMVVTQSITNSAGAELELSGGTVDAVDLTNDETGLINGFGVIDSSLDNEGDVVLIADTQIVGDLTNDGTVTLQSGVLTVSGSVSGSGEMIGDFTGKSSDNGLTVIGNYHIGQLGSLAVQSGTLKVGGDFDVEIGDSARFDLTNATLQMVGLPADGPQDLEVLAEDIGRHVTLSDPSLFAIGTLRIGPTKTVVRLADNHNNSAGAGSESLYVGELILEPGTTLDLQGLSLYFESVTPSHPLNPANGVTIIDSVGGGKLQLIGPVLAGDYDDDGDIDMTDYAEFSGCLTGPDGGALPGCDSFDFAADVDVDLTDFALFQEYYTGDFYE